MSSIYNTPIVASQQSRLDKTITVYGVKNVANFLASQETEERFKGNKTDVARFLATEFAMSINMNACQPAAIANLRTSINVFAIRIGSIINEVVMFDQESFGQQIYDILVARANFNVPYSNVCCDTAFISQYYKHLCEIKDPETLEYTKHIRALVPTMSTIRSIWDLDALVECY